MNQENQPKLVDLPFYEMDGMFNFDNDIEHFNRIYKLEQFWNADPQAMAERLKIFKNLIAEELTEIEDIIKKLEAGTYADKLSARTDIADLCGDLMVFSASEMERFQLPISDTLSVIMQSNFSKLGEDGQPIYRESDGKVMKGPNYWKPEPLLAELIEASDAARELGGSVDGCDLADADDSA